MHSPESFGIIILAAGSSSRMGQSKQLLQVGDITLLQHSVSVALAASPATIVVVLGDHADEHRANIAHLPVGVAIHENWADGMGSSIKKGLSHILSECPALDGCLVMVCDQPYITRNHIAQLVDVHYKTGKGMVASYYAGSAGVPVYFARKWFSELLNMENSYGAKKTLAAHPDDVTTVVFPGGEIDLDTPSDYQAFRESQ